jgi:heat shock protein HslJ
MRMKFTSPRTTVLNQMLELAPIVTSPMTCALSSMNAEGSIAGSFPSNARIGIDTSRLSGSEPEQALQVKSHRALAGDASHFWTWTRAN